MKDTAQVSVEYIIIAGVVLLLSIVVTALSINFFSSKDAVKEQAGILIEGAEGLVK